MGSMASTDSQATNLAPSKVGSMVFMQSEEIKKATEEYAQKVTSLFITVIFSYVLVLLCKLSSLMYLYYYVSCLLLCTCTIM